MKALANLYRVVHEQRNNKSSGGQRLYEEIKKVRRGCCLEPAGAREHTRVLMFDHQRRV